MRTLYSYWRSSAAYRVRIALNLKGLAYRTEPVNLLEGGGLQNTAQYQALNPQGLVPLLVDPGAPPLAQSLAIIEYLDQVYPQPALLPESPLERTQLRALALHVACEIHPLNNLRVLQYLQGELGATDEEKNAWYRHWLSEGLEAVEQGLSLRPDGFSLGDRPGYLEAVLIPQLYNARRYQVALSRWPRLANLEALCLALPAFQDAAPEAQPDAL